MTLYECTGCGEPTEAPVEATDSDVVPLDCPNPECESKTLTRVEDLCRIGRTIHIDTQDDSPCYNEATTAWPDEERPQEEEGEHPLCDEHYEEMTTFSLPDGAIGRCDEEDCNIAVWEKTDGELICEGCRE
jgi:hypothetical protein